MPILKRLCTKFPIYAVDELRTLCIPTKAATDDGQRKMLNSVCSKIAARLNTDEARALVQGLK